MKFNHDLVNRFVSDYKYPFPITFDEKLFKYYLKIFPKFGFDCKDKWKQLEKIINNEYSGDCNKFLDTYYEMRENIITTVSQDENYDLFNKMNMDLFKPTDMPKVKSNGVYNNDNIGKKFLSVDLANANFQALKYVNKGIVRYCDTYTEFIMSFCHNKPFLGKYISESKYSRNVIFGQLNPKRHIAIEKYIINEIRKEIEYWFKTIWCIDKNFKLVYMGADEIIYEVDSSNEIKDILYGLNKLEHILLFDVKAEYFELEGFNLCNKKGKTLKTIYYKKHPFNVSEYAKLKCVPLPFAPIIYKLFYNLRVNDKDKQFNYEGINTKFNENFKLIKIKS